MKKRIEMGIPILASEGFVGQRKTMGLRINHHRPLVSEMAVPAKGSA